MFLCIPFPTGISVFSHTAFCFPLFFRPYLIQLQSPSKMALISFPTNLFCRRTPAINSPPSGPKSSFSYNPWVNLKPTLKKQPQRAQTLGVPPPPLSEQASRRLRGFPWNRRLLSPVASAAEPESPAAPERSEPPRVEDRRAVETVQKLYVAIKNKNIKEVSELIGDECRCFCDFISASQHFNGKKQVLEFYDHLIRILGKNASLNFDLTMHDGMTVGVSWKLELKNIRVPLGSGVVFHACQEYGGKVVIKNVNMITDPLIHIGPLRMKIVGVVMLIMDKFGSPKLNDKRRKDIYMFLIFSLTFAVLFYLIKLRA